MPNGEINNLADAIVQVANWLEILTMDNEHNKSLKKFQDSCFKEMSDFLSECDSPFITRLMIRLTELYSTIYRKR